MDKVLFQILIWEKRTIVMTMTEAAAVVEGVVEVAVEAVEAAVAVVVVQQRE